MPCTRWVHSTLCRVGGSDLLLCSPQHIDSTLRPDLSFHVFFVGFFKIVVWATAVTDHMMVLVPPRELDWFQKNDGVDTLYASTDKGKVFARAQVSS